MRVGTATRGDADTTDIRAGGNIGAAVSYGDISFAGIGTTTAVCGEHVLAFGHPMLWTGPASLSLHSADALYVQEDAFVGFKVANLGGPVGTVDQDRIAGAVISTLVASDYATVRTEDLGGQQYRYYVTVLWPRLDAFAERLGLPPVAAMLDEHRR